MSIMGRPGLLVPLFDVAMSAAAARITICQLQRTLRTLTTRNCGVLRGLRAPPQPAKRQRMWWYIVIYFNCRIILK